MRKTAVVVLTCVLLCVSTAEAAGLIAKLRGRDSAADGMFPGSGEVEGLEKVSKVLTYRGQTFTPTGQSEPVGGGRRDRHRRPDQLGQHLLGLGAAGPDLGPVTDDLHGRITHPETRLLHQLTHMTQHVGAGSEDPAEVTEARRTEQRVAHGMGGDITVGMTCAPVGVFKLQAQQPTRPPRLDRVDVGTQPDPWNQHVISTPHAP